jgi:hypothetical protein
LINFGHEADAGVFKPVAYPKCRSPETSSRPHHPSPLYSGTAQALLRACSGKAPEVCLDKVGGALQENVKLLVRTLTENKFRATGPRNETLGESTATRFHFENLVRILIHFFFTIQFSVVILLHVYYAH